jgi:hypothetical protein
MFLHCAAEADFNSFESSLDTQSAFDNFYLVAVNLLETFYPLRTVTVTSRDP